MGDGLARILSKHDFNPDLFVSKQTNKQLVNVVELIQLRDQIKKLESETSQALKKNVYKNYNQFIETAKEISILEGEMYQLSHLLTDQKTLMSSFLELSLSGGSQADMLEINSNSVEDDIKNQTNLARLFEKVEGCSLLNDSGIRCLLHDGDVTEINAESMLSIKKVHLYLLNDKLMVTTWLQHRKGPFKFRFEALYELKSLAVVNIKDTETIKNAFKILMFPDSRFFSVETPKAKRVWIEVIEEAKRKLSQDEQKKENVIIQSPSKSDLKTSESRLSLLSELKELNQLDWLKEAPEDLDVFIAQRDFDSAVNLITKVNECLESSVKTSPLKDYKLRIDHRVKQLSDILANELKISPEQSLRGGPRASWKVVTQLINLGKSSLACEIFLENRSNICRYSIRQLKTESNTMLYMEAICKIFFTSLIDVAAEFHKIFPQNSGCFSMFVLWACQEVNYFASLFISQVFISKADFNVAVQCVVGARNSCRKLREVGLDVTFVLDRVLNSDIERLMQQAGDNQMDAIRHRAADDLWKPMNYQNSTLLNKFVKEMEALGLNNIHEYSFDKCFTTLTPNTIQFSQAYVTFSADLCRLYTSQHRNLIIVGLVDILRAQLQHLRKSLDAAATEKEAQIIQKNAHFFAVNLIPQVINIYEEASSQTFSEMRQLQADLKPLYTSSKAFKGTVVVEKL